jgi:hypothetical protein
MVLFQLLADMNKNHIALDRASVKTVESGSEAPSRQFGSRHYENCGGGSWRSPRLVFRSGGGDILFVTLKPKVSLQSPSTSGRAPLRSRSSVI